MAFVISQKAARALTRIVRGAADATAPTYGPATISPDEYPAPWTVRWAQSELNGSGAWVIWMVSGTPSVSSQALAYLDTDALAPDNLIAATTLPTGWYRMYNVGSDRRSVYLRIVVPHGTGPVQCSLTGNYPSPVSDADNYRIPVAIMSVDSSTGARRVKQYLKSVVGISSQNGGESVTLDDVSTDYNDDTEVQIKDWDTGTPTASTTIAQDIANGDETAQGKLVSRTTGGVLQYKLPGYRSQLTGTALNLSSQDIITGIEWTESTRELYIQWATVKITDGIIQEWIQRIPKSIIISK